MSTSEALTMAEEWKIDKFLQSVYSYNEDLLRNPSHFDVTISCNGTSWKCQRAILCQRCPFFKAALSGQFEESITQNVDLKEDDPVAVDLLLLFLYTMQWPEEHADDKQAMEYAAHAFQIGDKYGVTVLKDTASDLIMEWYENDGSYPETWTVLSSFQITQRIWRFQMEGSDKIKDFIIKTMVNHARQLTGDDNMLWLFEKEPDFMQKYLKTLRWQLLSEPSLI